METKDIYKFSYDFLVKKGEGYVTKEQIDAFISESDVQECNMASIYEILLNILQDFNIYPNVIKFEQRKEEIKKIIHFPDLKYCASLDYIELKNEFKRAFQFENEKCWLNYSKGVVSGAKFLSEFDTYEDFKNLCESFDENVFTREAFALLLSTKISNMGFAIACNWLKEIGYKNYPKPDVHIKDICKAIGVLDEQGKDGDCFEQTIKIAECCGVEPYRLDKVWWLICSGNFYRDSIKIKMPAKKAEFIAALKANCRNEQ